MNLSKAITMLNRRADFLRDQVDNNGFDPTRTNYALMEIAALALVLPFAEEERDYQQKVWADKAKKKASDNAKAPE